LSWRLLRFQPGSDLVLRLKKRTANAQRSCKPMISALPRKLPLVRIAQPWLRASAPQNQQLLPQEKIVGDQPTLGLNAAAIAQTRKRPKLVMLTAKPVDSHFAPHS
jgi:hypothetical protein